MSGEIVQQLIPANYIYWVCGVLFSALNAAVVFMGRLLFHRVEKLWKDGQGTLLETKQLLTTLNAEVTTQRTNCLTTLQEQGRTQISILERIAESVSYLKGRTDSGNQ